MRATKAIVMTGEESDFFSKHSRWVEAARMGDRAAFDRLAAQYRPMLTGLAFLRTGDTAESEDLVQEALALAWTRLPTLTNAEAFPAWLRVILANRANRWYRRPGAAAVDLSAMPDRAATDIAATPLPALLRRERQSELQTALWQLPEANRIAFMMQVCGGYSYEEIAALTQVLPSTVEGRIYRARRRLRTILTNNTLDDSFQDSNREPLLGSRRTVPGAPVSGVFRTGSHSLREKNMPKSRPDALEADELALNCVLFAERFSRLIDGGVSLVRALQALEEMPPPYGPAAADLNRSLQTGTTLSTPMQERPDLFSPIYIALVRVGEIGGILEETLARARTVLTREWHLGRQRPEGEPRIFFSLPTGQGTPKSWADLTVWQRLITNILFCETLAMLLSSGVPQNRALGVAAELLPEAQRASVDPARLAADTQPALRPVLEEAGILPAFALELIDTGERHGALPANLHQIVETFEHELSCRFPIRNGQQHDTDL